jgi:hypothetical protein
MRGRPMSRCKDGLCGACDWCVPNLDQEKLEEDLGEQRYESDRQRKIDAGTDDL